MAKKAKEFQYYEAVGRRKESVALVRLYITDKTKSVTVNGKKIVQGEMIVNDKPLAISFGRDAEQKKCVFPLDVTSTVDRFAISIHVSGGGKNGQIEAIRHGISRALTLVDPESFTTLLRKYSLLTRDPRVRERRKVGTGGKARRQKQSPKR